MGSQRTANRPALCQGDGTFTRYHYDALSWVAQSKNRALSLEEIHRFAELRYPVQAAKTTWRTAISKLVAAGYLEGEGTAPRRLTRKGADVIYFCSPEDFPPTAVAAKKRVYADKWAAELLSALKARPEGIPAEEIKRMPMGAKGGPTIERLLAEGRAAWANGRLCPLTPPKRQSLF